MRHDARVSVARRSCVRPGSYAGAWALAAVAAVANIAALYFNWYEWSWFDEGIHLYSFFAIALVVALHVYAEDLAHRKALLVFTVLCVGLALGVVWEWAEWAYDRLSGPQNLIHGKADTLMDLMMDGIGAVVAGIVAAALVRRPEWRPTEELTR